MTADYFDHWYADIAQSDARQALFTEALGVPPEVGPSNLVPLAGLQEIASLLRVPADGELVDFACGRGGPGMWIARELGVELIGIDFSAEAIAQASARRKLFGLADRSTFAIGELDDSGLIAGSADAVMCIDAFQFGRDRLGTASEMRRVLRPGGTVVLTCWEPIDRTADGLSERMRDIDLGASLAAAGFDAVTVMERPAWRDHERALWDKVMTIDAAGDPAMESARNEANRTLATFDLSRRVIATATAP